MLIIFEISGKSTMIPRSTLRQATEALAWNTLPTVVWQALVYTETCKVRFQIWSDSAESQMALVHEILKKKKERKIETCN